MKKRQMLLAVILMLSLAFAFAPGSFAKKKAPKLNKTKVTLQVGKNATLKVKNTSKKVTWKSSNKSVATVSKKGVVKAKKEGKATITAKVAGKSLKCKVTVKAKTPVTPTSQTLKYVGQMPLEDKIERQKVGSYTKEELEAKGYKDVPGEYHYGDDSYYYMDENGKVHYYYGGATVYVDVPVTIKTASAVCKTTGTKIGNYNGNTRYELNMTGSAEMPTKGYIWKVYENTKESKREKVEIDLPGDADDKVYQSELKAKIENRIRINAKFFNKGTEYKYTGEDDGDNTYVLRNLGDTDKKFEGYVSACTMDTTGNFTYKVYDVSIFDSLSYFRLNVNSSFEPLDNSYYDE